MKLLKLSLAFMLISASVYSICDSSLWDHVYNKERLHVFNNCTTVTGVIAYKPKPEPDGDYHIRLKVDNQFQNLLNAKNISSQNGSLVVEIIYGTSANAKRCVEVSRALF